MTADEVRVRRATEGDIPFLVETIVGAEKSGTDKLSYCHIFGLPEDDFRGLLAEILEEDIPGQELCVSGFLVAERAGRPAGAVCGWIEGTGSKASTIIKGSLLMHFLGRERVAAAASNLKLMEVLSLPRAKGGLQLESVYVAADHRGLGISARLLDEHQALARHDNPALERAQIVLAGGNGSALAAYEKAGFRIVDKRSSANPRVLDLLPAASKVLMERRLTPPTCGG